MVNILLKKLKESFLSVLPISLIVVILSIVFCPLDANTYITFCISAILLIIGMSLFTMGTDMSMSQMGESIGKSLYKSKKLSLMIICTAFIGFIITFAEPDLAVLARQISNMGILQEEYLFIAVVSIGVGIFLIFAILKAIFNLKLSIILAIGYSLLFIFCFFVPDYMVPIAFDSGSVTTGPISVPFLISFGLGIASMGSSGKSNDDNALGYIALSSLGPIIAVMTLGLFLPKDIVIITSQQTTDTLTGLQLLGTSFVDYLKEVALTILPIIIIFLIFQFTMLKLSKTTLKRIIIGLIYTYVGVVLFLTGVNAGYLPIASILGNALASSSISWILIPLSVLLGYFIIAAEPAVQVLKKQIEEVTNGGIRQKTILVCVSIGVALSVLLAMLKTLYNIPLIAILLPVYGICIGLSFFNSSLFVSIAFDAGGTATGAMAVSFILPFLAGVAAVVGADSGFGTIALIAAMPILTLQILGAMFKVASKRGTKASRKVSKVHVEIIEFE